MTFPKCEPFQFSDSSGPRYLWGVRLEGSTGQEKIVEHQRIGGCGGKTGEEWARLFAAAPDLLAALKSLLDKPVRYNDKRIEIDCNGHADAMQRVRAARAAFAKATGV